MQAEKTIGGNIIFKTNENGKPFIENGDNFHFNISHTKNAFAVAVSDEAVGIDIEKIRPIDYTKLNKFIDFNTENENDFFEIWTKKEASVKRDGKAIKDLKTAEIKNTEAFNLGDYILSVAFNNKDDIQLIKI